MRDDVHRPAIIEPADYDFVAFECLKVEDFGAAQYMVSQREIISEHRSRTGAQYSTHAHGGNCHVCGAHAIYTALFLHRPTNVYVRTGLECAEKLECGDVEGFRRVITSALGNRRGKRKAQARLEVEGIPEAWTLYESDDQRREESTVRDIVGKLVQYGSISEGQMRYVRSLVDKVKNRAANEAKRQAESEGAAPVPVTGERTVVRGKIVAVRRPDKHEGGFTPVRILVQHDEGWKVWGSRPTSLAEAKHGDVVEFKAAIKPSEKDPKFGYFSRPTSAKLVESRA